MSFSFLDVKKRELEGLENGRDREGGIRKYGLPFSC